MRGWFDAFRDDGAPTWYGEMRTGVVVDVQTLIIAVSFAIVYVAFLVIFPGLRKKRLASFLTVTLQLFTGAVLLICIFHPSWKSGLVKIEAPYKAFSSDLLKADLGVNIGLQQLNVTLSSDLLTYNERFYFTEVRSMQEELQKALRRGLPYPILTVLEYMAVDQAGFIWGRQFRVAGYYTRALLWFAVGLWALTILLLMLTPQHYSRGLIGLGLVILLAPLIYGSCSAELKIPFPPQFEALPGPAILNLALGASFWLVLATGFLNILFGSVLRVIEVKKIYALGTFLQLPHDLDNIYRNERPDAQAEPAAPSAPVPSHILETEFVETPVAPDPLPKTQEKLRVLHRRRSRSVGHFRPIVGMQAGFQAGIQNDRIPTEIQVEDGPSTSKASLNNSRF